MNLFDVYSIFPINIVRGSGCYVYDDNGNSYLDFYGGHAVISIGHSHPYLVKCMYEQMQNLMFYSNSVVNKLQEKLAYELGEISGYSDYSAFFVNSGAEANENALKLASFHTGKKKVIAFRNSFHGRTSAAVEVTDNPLITAPLNCNDNVYFSGMDIAEVESVLRSGDVCAVIIEGISGVGGIRVPEDDFLKELRKVTIQYGAILIMDEIQSGYGRTGKFFAHQWSGIKPDIITVAKGIANGFPFSGVLISDVFKPRKGMLVFALSLMLWIKKGKPVFNFTYRQFFIKLYAALKTDKYLPVMLFGVIFMLVVSVGLILLSPVVNPDAQAYHVLRSLLWVFDKKIFHPPVADVRNLVMPVNSELLYAWIILFIKKDVLFGAFSFCGYLLSITSLWGILSYIGTGFKRKLWVITLLSSFAFVIIQLSSTETDIIISGLILSSIFLFNIN